MLGNDLYFLDFIDQSGTHRDITNLYVHYFEYGSTEIGLLEPCRAKWGKRGPIDLCTLGPGLTYQICDAKRPLKRIAFISKDCTTVEPFVSD